MSSDSKRGNSSRELRLRRYRERVFVSNSTPCFLFIGGHGRKYIALTSPDPLTLVIVTEIYPRSISHMFTGREKGYSPTSLELIGDQELNVLAVVIVDRPP